MAQIQKIRFFSYWSPYLKGENGVRTISCIAYAIVYLETFKTKVNHRSIFFRLDNKSISK